MTTHRLYFSHSYDLEDLRFNQHFWKLLMAKEFHAWIDTGRDIAVNKDQSGVRRPMDIAFNEWMMSQCDGFAVIVPRKRKSPYQQLEYRLAERMGVPRLVALPEGGTFKAPEREIVSYPTSWKLFWNDDAQSRLRDRIADFAVLVTSHEAAGEVLRSVGHWRARRTKGQLDVALFAPRADDLEWHTLQVLLQENDEVDWTLLSPVNIQVERELLEQTFDLLVVDVGPRGTPQEALGYIHAIGIPQIRLCRVRNDDEEQDIEAFLDGGPRRKPRSLYEQVAPSEPVRALIPRFLDGFKLDKKMQPVIFWKTVNEAA